MTEPKPPADAASFFARGGATGTLLAQLDWAQSTLGPVASWPPALRSALELALLSRSSTCVWWGPRFVQLYNDAAIAMLGERHPKSLGQTGAEVWTSHWTSMGPLLEATYRGASGQSSSALELMVPRGGRVDEAHFNFSYAPIPTAPLTRASAACSRRWWRSPRRSTRGASSARWPSCRRRRPRRSPTSRPASRRRSPCH